MRTPVLTSLKSVFFLVGDLSLRHRALALGLISLLTVPALPAQADEQTSWQGIETLRHALTIDPPAGQNSVEYEAPIEAQLHQASDAFAREFPDSSHHWEAVLTNLKTVFFPVPAEERRAIFADQEAKLAAILAAPNTPEPVRLDAERTVLRQHLDHLDLVTTSAEALALGSRLAALVEKNPGDPKIGALQVRRVDLLAKADPGRAADLLNTLAASPDPRVAGAAKGRLAQRALGNGSLDWDFVDASGSPFHADAYHGKVLLVDFWASWCPDCQREMPKVIEAYQRYHSRGLEVLGISLDKNKDALTAFTKKHGIPWPQYFDGKGWSADLAVRYGVQGIPEMWLVDETGRVVATGLHGDDLDQRIAGLINQ